MIEARLVERAAQTLDNAWAVKYRRARGSQKAADALLMWLNQRRVSEKSPVYRSLQAAALNGEPPAGVSSCDEFEAIRWFTRDEFLFAYDTDHRLFVFRQADLEVMPEVPIEAVRAE